MLDLTDIVQRFAAISPAKTKYTSLRQCHLFRSAKLRQGDEVAHYNDFVAIGS